MTIQEKRASLSRCCVLERETARQRLELQRLRAMAEGISSPGFGMPHGGRAQDRMQQAASRLLDLQEEMAENILRACSLRREIEGAISALPEEKLRELLRRRYLDGMKWEEIAEAMHYSRMQLYRLHMRALQQLPLEKMLHNVT